MDIPWQLSVFFQALLDATHRTCRYVLPLFFICVNTNVMYITVAFFLVEHEDAASITEALEIIKAWNPDWDPEAIMIDFSLPEFNAVKHVWPCK